MKGCAEWIVGLAIIVFLLGPVTMLAPGTPTDKAFAAAVESNQEAAMGLAAIGFVIVFYFVAQMPADWFRFLVLVVVAFGIAALFGIGLGV